MRRVHFAIDILVITAVFFWAVWSEYRIQGLETRMNLQEASQHWQDEPPAKESK